MRIALLPWFVVCGAACTGSIAGTEETSTGGTSAVPGATGSGASGAGAAPGSTAPGTPPLHDFQAAPAGLRRLTVSQYRASVEALLGVQIDPSALEADLTSDGLVAIGASQSSVSTRGAELYGQAAAAAAHQAFADPARAMALLGCAPAAPATDPCTRGFISKFALRAWRRPPTSAEVDRYAALASTAVARLGTPWAGVETAVAAMLESPKFIYRAELGEPDPQSAKRRRYTAYEMATRLSFFLTNVTPDDALLESARKGETLAVAGLKAQADRLLATPRARQAFDTFVIDKLDLDQLDSFHRDPKLFPQMTPTLGASMRQETLSALEDVAFGSGRDFLEILDTNTTFVNTELARLYKMSAPSAKDFVKTALPADGPRAGLLGHASVLAINAHDDGTSPTKRGKFIREMLLCQAIPPPPANVVTALKDPPAGVKLTRRELLTQHRADPTCAGCHKITDPVGLGLENFDAIGAFRTTDQGLAIDPSGDLDGAAFTDARQLAQAVRRHADAAPCVVRSLYRYATGHIETDGEAPVLADLVKAFQASGRSFLPLAGAIGASDGFRFASAPR
jgi:hypothetical protein